MRRPSLLLFALLVLFPRPGRTQDGNDEASRQKGILAGAIHLEEVPEEKRGPFLLPFGAGPQDVDINSTIHVRISPDDLLAGLAAEPVLTPAAREAVTLRQGARQLQQAEGFLRNAIEEAEELARLELTGRRNSAEFRAIAEKDQAGLLATFQLLDSYLASLLASPREDLRQHAAEARTDMSRAVEIGRPALAAAIVKEIHWTLEQLEAARVRVDQDAPPVALILSASHVRPGGETELGLEHYNDLPIGVPKSIEKLSQVLPPEMVALHADAAALAAELNRLRGQGAGLIGLARQILAAQGFDFDELEEALDRVGESAEQLGEADWGQAGSRLEARVREALQDATGEEKQLLEALLPAVSELKARTRDLRSSGELVATVRSLRSQLEATAGASPTDRMLRLLSLLQVGSGLASGERLADLQTDLKRWADAVTALQEQIVEVRNASEDLPAELAEEIEGILEGAAAGSLGDLATHLQELRTAAAGLRDRFRTLSAELEGVPELAVALHRDPPETSFRVSFPEIKDTWVDIRTLNPRADDDLLVLRAWLFRMKPDPSDPTRMIEAEELDSDVQQLRMLRFGWYSNPAVGLVYLRSRDEVPQAGEDGETGEAKEIRTFAPQVSWLFRYRPWQERAANAAFPSAFRYRPRWWHSVGVGLHTVTLDLNTDNQPEMGLGLSVSLFKDFLQIGAGWDLSLDDEPYVFIGTRLLELARGLGTSNRLEAPEE